jgi:hypothetical protein
MGEKDTERDSMALQDSVIELDAYIADLQAKLDRANAARATLMELCVVPAAFRERGKRGLHLHGPGEDPKRERSPKETSHRGSVARGKEIRQRMVEVMRTRPAGMTAGEIAEAIREDVKTVNNMLSRYKSKAFANPQHGTWTLIGSQLSVPKSFTPRSSGPESNPGGS